MLAYTVDGEGEVMAAQLAAGGQRAETDHAFTAGPGFGDRVMLEHLRSFGRCREAEPELSRERLIAALSAGDPALASWWMGSEGDVLWERAGTEAGTLVRTRIAFDPSGKLSEAQMFVQPDSEAWFERAPIDSYRFVYPAALEGVSGAGLAQICD